MLITTHLPTHPDCTAVLISRLVQSKLDFSFSSIEVARSVSARKIKVTTCVVYTHTDLCECVCVSVGGYTVRLRLRYGTVRILDTERAMHVHDEEGSGSVESGAVLAEVEQKGTDGRKTKKKKKEHVRKKAWKPKTKTGCKTCR